VSAGTQHTCALLGDGTAYCWGRNDFGQLGDSTLADTTQPAAVAGGLKFTTVTVGFRHSCGLTLSGAAYCWGDNQLGQLGDTLVVQASVPTPVSGGFSFTRLSASGSHTCGVTSANVARCWGAGVNGQLGSAPTNQCLGPSAAGPCSPLPQLVTGGYNFTEISAGTQHTCAITSAQQAFCWGLNSNGQLGSAAVAMSWTPLPVSARP
jgi:alpha-tubulin suppressor-like RCC1 family protein